VLTSAVWWTGFCQVDLESGHQRPLAVLRARVGAQGHRRGLTTGAPATRPAAPPTPAGWPPGCGSYIAGDLAGNRGSVRYGERSQRRVLSTRLRKNRTFRPASACVPLRAPQQPMMPAPRYLGQQGSRGDAVAGAERKREPLRRCRRGNASPGACLSARTVMGRSLGVMPFPRTLPDKQRRPEPIR